MDIAFASRRIFAAVAVLLCGSVIAYSWSELSDEWLDVVYVPTPHQVVKRMLEIARVGPGDIHYDLGSGDGRIAIASVQDFKAAKSVGIELDPERIKESLENRAQVGTGERVTFLQQDIFKTDFSEATVVTLYLLNRLNLRLRPALLAMRPGTRVVTQSFTMSEWEADYSEEVAFEESGLKGTRNVYLYLVPARVEGKWTLLDGANSLSLEIGQRFQNFDGSASAEEKTFEIKNGRLTGAMIAFELEIGGKAKRYEGRVDGDVMTGAGWSAKKNS